jgi:drug/metabolite transporter (DMT)-like permease
VLIGLLLALSASLLWGTADFAGGRLSRGLPLLVVVAVSQGAGLVCLLLVLLVRGAAEWAAFGWGAIAGLLSIGSVTCLYRALALGTMGVVAPIVATSAVVPVLVGVASGERPGPQATAGTALALSGVALASRHVAHDPPVDHRRSIVLAVVAAAFAGVQLVALQRAGSIDAVTGVAGSRATSVAMFVVVLLLTRTALPRRALPAVGLVGVLDTAANLAYTVATTRALLSLTAVLASLYPLVTVVLARTLLLERLRRAQWAGTSAAVLGVLLIAAG